AGVLLDHSSVQRFTACSRCEGLSLGTVLSDLRHGTGLSLLVLVKPPVHPATDLLFLLSISFLQRARKLVVIAFDLQQIVIGKLAPLFLEFPFELFPLSLELFAIHGRPPS